MLFQKEPSAREKWCITCSTSEWEPYFLSKRATYPLKKSHIFLCSFERVIREWEMMYYTQHMWIRANHPPKKSHKFVCSFKRVVREWEVMYYTLHMWIRAIHPLKKSHIFLRSFKRAICEWEVMYYTQHMWVSHVHTAICTLKKKPCVISKKAPSRTEPWSSQKEPYSPLKKSPISSPKELILLLEKEAYIFTQLRHMRHDSFKCQVCDSFVNESRTAYSWMSEWITNACWWRDARTAHSWMSGRVKFVTHSWMSSSWLMCTCPSTYSSWLTHSLMNVQWLIHERVKKSRTACWFRDAHYTACPTSLSINIQFVTHSLTRPYECSVTHSCMSERVTNCMLIQRCTLYSLSHITSLSINIQFVTHPLIHMKWVTNCMLPQRCTLYRLTHSLIYERAVTHPWMTEWVTNCLLMQRCTLYSSDIFQSSKQSSKLKLVLLFCHVSVDKNIWLFLRGYMALFERTYGSHSLVYFPFATFQ